MIPTQLIPTEPPEEETKIIIDEEPPKKEKPKTRGFRKWLDNDAFMVGMILTFVLYAWLIFNYMIGLSTFFNLILVISVITVILILTIVPVLNYNEKKYSDVDYTRYNLHYTVWYTVLFSGAVLALTQLTSLVTLNFKSILAILFFSFVMMEFHVNFIAKKGNYTLSQVAWIKLKGLIVSISIILNILLLRGIIIQIGWIKVLIVILEVIRTIGIVSFVLAGLLLLLLLIILLLKLNQKALMQREESQSDETMEENSDGRESELY